MKCTAESLLLWEQRIKQRIQSGLKIEEWCEKNDLSTHQYYYWNRRVREKQNYDEDVIFADITSTLSKSDTTTHNPVLYPDFQIFLNDIRITVPSDFNPEALSGLMKVLQAL